MTDILVTVDNLETDRGHRRPHQQPAASPLVELDLARELEALYREPEWSTGQNAKTLVKYDDFRVVLTVLKPHRKMASHGAEGRLSIQTLRGHVLLRAEGRTFDLRAGRVVALDRGVAHELEAIEETAILQTIAWPAKAPDNAQPSTSV